jgi:hypothetical protein
MARGVRRRPPVTGAADGSSRALRFPTPSHELSLDPWTNSVSKRRVNGESARDGRVCLGIDDPHYRGHFR